MKNHWLNQHRDRILAEGLAPVCDPSPVDDSGDNFNIDFEFDMPDIPAEIQILPPSIPGSPMPQDYVLPPVVTPAIDIPDVITVTNDMISGTSGNEPIFVSAIWTGCENEKSLVTTVTTA